MSWSACSPLHWPAEGPFRSAPGQFRHPGSSGTRRDPKWMRFGGKSAEETEGFNTPKLLDLNIFSNKVKISEVHALEELGIGIGI